MFVLFIFVLVIMTVVVCIIVVLYYYIVLYYIYYYYISSIVEQSSSYMCIINDEGLYGFEGFVLYSYVWDMKKLSRLFLVFMIMRSVANNLFQFIHLCKNDISH